jgi:hypothetical protein
MPVISHMHGSDRRSSTPSFSSTGRMPVLLSAPPVRYEAAAGPIPTYGRFAQYPRLCRHSRPGLAKLEISYCSSPARSSRSTAHSYMARSNSSSTASIRPARARSRTPCPPRSSNYTPKHARCSARPPPPGSPASRPTSSPGSRRSGPAHVLKPRPPGHRTAAPICPAECPRPSSSSSPRQNDWAPNDSRSTPPPAARPAAGVHLPGIALDGELPSPRTPRAEARRPAGAAHPQAAPSDCPRRRRPCRTRPRHTGPAPPSAHPPACPRPPRPPARNRTRSTGTCSGTPAHGRRARRACISYLVSRISPEYRRSSLVAHGPPSGPRRACPQANPPRAQRTPHDALRVLSVR